MKDSWKYFEICVCGFKLYTM